MRFRARIYEAWYGNLTVIGSGPVIACRTGNDKHVLETLVEFRARVRLVPRSNRVILPSSANEDVNILNNINYRIFVFSVHSC